MDAICPLNAEVKLPLVLLSLLHLNLPHKVFINETPLHKKAKQKTGVKSCGPLGVDESIVSSDLVGLFGSVRFNCS